MWRAEAQELELHLNPCTGSGGEVGALECVRAALSNRTFCNVANMLYLHCPVR